MNMNQQLLQQELHNWRNQTGIDLASALEKNIQKKSTRDAARHQNNEKLQR